MDNITLALIKAIAGNSGGGSVTPGKDGVGISKIEKTDTQGLVDTYTISYTNGTTTTFTVTNGQNGADGANGKDGVAATISVGKVSAGEAGTDPIVHNSGTSNVAVFDFTIPKGDPGTTVYGELLDKPSINGVILEGAKTFGDFGIQSSTDDSLNTADKTIVGAINELLAKINTLTPAEGEALLTVSTGSSE